MASYSFNASIISRGNGGSITAIAAYISGEKIRDNYEGKIHDRSYRNDVLHKKILLPHEAPNDLLNRQILLDALNISETRSDSQMARIIRISLPNELSHDEHISLVNEFVYENFIKIGMCADICIHEGLHDVNRKSSYIKPVTKHEDNPHAHVLIPFRSVDKNGFLKTKTQTRYLNSRKHLVIWRKDWARLQNREFERLGLNIRVTHESYATQGINRIPTKHLGAATIALELRDIRTDRGNEYRDIIERNRNRDLERFHSINREPIREFNRER